MAMTAADYKAAGEAAAHIKANGGNLEHVHDREGKGWQARAYWEGYDSAERKRSLGKRIRATTPKCLVSLTPSGPFIVDGPVDDIDLNRMPSNTTGWPQAAAHHATCLVKDLLTERSMARRQRLRLALTRMQKRYQHINRNQGTLV